MLELEIKDLELYDDDTGHFQKIKGGKLILEHSLLAVSKWESKYHIPFLEHIGKEMTVEESLYYVQCMTINKNIDPSIYDALTAEDMQKILDYINDPYSATVINVRNKNRVNREPVTSEMIYYWMVVSTIPFECEKWHLARLMKLIEIYGIKNSEPEKKSTSQILREQDALNKKRRAMLHSKG
jgi:hypothetical protein